MQFYDSNGDTHNHRTSMYYKNIKIGIKNTHKKVMYRCSDAIMSDCEADVEIVQRELCPWCLMNSPETLEAFSRILAHFSYYLKDCPGSKYAYMRLLETLFNGNVPINR